MPSVFARKVVPTPICHLPALSAAICCGSWRAAARMSAQVSSAAAWDGVLARRHHDAEARTGGNVDVRIDAALADEFEAGQAFEQVGLNPRALADEDQAFGILEPRRERVGILHVVVKDRNLVPLELLEAGKRAQRVEIIVEDRNLHALRSASRRGRSCATFGARPNAFPFTNRARDRRDGGAPTGGDSDESVA